MANEPNKSAEEKKKLKQDKKQLKQEEAKQKKDIKKRAKEIAKKQAEIADEEDPKGISSFLITLIIVAVWLAIICFCIKMNIGGFGSEYLTPLLKDVPIVNMILPDESTDDTDEEGGYGGYTNLKEAVDYINVLEAELEQAQSVNDANAEELTELTDEVDRLREFEDRQVEFQRIYEQFYEEVIYSDKGPGAEAFKEYYESIDPTTAEALYKQVIQEMQEDEEVSDYVAAYSSMKAKQAAAILEETDANLAARILEAMDSDARGDILGAMDSTTAAKLTEIMDPES